VKKMKTFVTGLIAAVMALSVFATAGFAVAPSGTMVNSNLDANGVTYYKDYATVSGFDSTEMKWQETAFVLENVYNNGQLELEKSVANPSAWEMWEATDIDGNGITTITKQVGWWTEDNRLKQDGTMLYPTEANIFVGYNTDGVAWNNAVGQQSSYAVEIHNIANANVQTYPGEFSGSEFLINVGTADPIDYRESVGIGLPFFCEPFDALYPTMPSCPGGHCVK
jgi:hypothetical protein